MNNSKNVGIGIAFVVLAVGLVWLWGGRQADEPRAHAAPGTVSALRADESRFSFGSVSMRAGNVTHVFKVKNTGETPVRVTKLYTSCMCTTARLKAAAGEAGPFGMPGHGFVPRVDVAIAPGEEAAVEAVFDPAAHGPAGIGKIERVVYLETADDEIPVELAFSADVTP